MDNISNFLRKYGVYMATGAAVLGGAKLYMYLRKTRQSYTERVCGVDYPKDVVILHHSGRERTIPSLGHFVMKLETYLRFHKIPFQSESTPGNFNTGPKKKSPWIEYNGTTISDSQMIIEFLNNKFNIDMDSHLTTLEKAQAWAIQKWLEEFTYWLSVRTRWVIFSDEHFEEGIPFPSFNMSHKKHVKDWVDNMTYTAGIGRHSDKEVQDMLVYDLRQFSVLLGDKKFVMGDKMAVVDCVSFGILSEMIWATPSVCRGKQLFKSGEISNVVKYLERIRAQYWPDWESILSK